MLHLLIANSNPRGREGSKYFILYLPNIYHKRKMMILTQTKYYKYKPFLTSMKGGESDTTQSSLAVMPILVMTIVLLHVFPHGIKKCDYR